MPFLLRDLPGAMRIGLSGVVVSILIGLWASVAYLEVHHENRDGESGVSLTDLRGAYHGVESPAPLCKALERGHPEDLPAAERDLLLRWLDGGRISEEYDDLDLGDAAPAEVLASRCTACHARNAGDAGGIARSMPLEYWDDVEKLAFSRSIAPTPKEILLVSTHTHALALGTLTLVMMLLLSATRTRQERKNGLVMLAGLGLLGDLVGWWLARGNEVFVYLVVVAGACWALSMAATCLLVLLDLWLPKRTESGSIVRKIEPGSA